jgi:adenine-specific DNA methylase
MAAVPAPRSTGVPAPFTAKAPPAADKLRGGYYTPAPIARYLAGWVAEAGPRLLEPSCGDGAVLTELVGHAGPDGVVGVELVAGEAATAAARSGATVVTGDFFRWFTPARYGTFDGVAGNPPYIRFGSWAEPARARALDLVRSVGLRPTRLTNAWVPFVVASVLAVRPGGRVALVLPAELLQVGYAAALRSHLVDSCTAVTVVSFRRLVFRGVIQEVVLHLAERGPGPATIRTVEVSDAGALTALSAARTPAPRALLHESEKWTKYHLGSDGIEAVRRMRADPRLRPLRAYAEVDVGVVSGRNSFFCLTAADADRRGLTEVTVPLVSRSAQLAGLVLSEEDFGALSRSDASTRLLAVPPGASVSGDLARYLAEGESGGVHTGYKCRIRRTWWQIPAAWVPDGFLLRQISSHPRLTANRAGATSTDTVHRVRARPGVATDRLAAGAHNSVTFALAEVLGRSYGGGILELEPSEAEDLPVPDPAVVPASLVGTVDELVRGRRVEDALDLVDRVVLVEALGFDAGEVARLRGAWTTLRDRRAVRGRGRRG